LNSVSKADLGFPLYDLFILSSYDKRRGAGDVYTKTFSTPLRVVFFLQNNPRWNRESQLLAT